MSLSSKTGAHLSKHFYSVFSFSISATHRINTPSLSTLSKQNATYMYNFTESDVKKRSQKTVFERNAQNIKPYDIIILFFRQNGLSSAPNQAHFLSISPALQILK